VLEDCRGETSTGDSDKEESGEKKGLGGRVVIELENELTKLKNKNKKSPKTKKNQGKNSTNTQHHPTPNRTGIS
jgi:hypothetical protein